MGRHSCPGRLVTQSLESNRRREGRRVVADWILVKWAVRSVRLEKLVGTTLTG